MPLPGAFVYTELQISVPFDAVPVDRINAAIQARAGFLNKTWLSGFASGSAGGFYAFDTVADAVGFVTDYFPDEAKGFGVAQTTRIYDATALAEASRSAGSVHFGARHAEPAAFVYSEAQVALDPARYDTAAANAALAATTGHLSRTWLSGLNTGTLGAFDAFSSLEAAQKFALETYPAEAASLGAAFTTRLFEAATTKAASLKMSSPYYPA